MVEESVRKTAAKKTVRKAVGRTAAVTRAPRTRTAPAVDSEEQVAAQPKRPRRKAPTPVAETTAQSKRNNRLLFVGVGIFVALFVLSAVIGFMDSGAINVRGIIESRMASATPEEKARLEQAQKATANNVPDGGLSLSETQTTPAPIATTSPETASSTDASATSTEAVAEDATSEAEALPDDGLVPTE